MRKEVKPKPTVNTARKNPRKTTRQIHPLAVPNRCAQQHEKNHPTPIDTAELVRDISSTSFSLRTLELSCSSFPGSRPLFSIASALFDKNTRGGIPFPILASSRSRVTNHVRRASEAQKRAPVSPFAATLTHSLFCNPFVCH